jgi:hypothetical protein
MWGDQFNFDPNEDILTPAEKRRLEEKRKAVRNWQKKGTGK